MDNSIQQAMSVEFDHADLGSKPVSAIILTFQCENKYLIALDGSSISGKTESIMNSLKTRSFQALKIKINAFISYYASSCKRARDGTCQSSEYNHCDSHRCIAHLLNLVIKMIKGDAQIYEIVKRAKTATEILSERKDLQRLLQNSGVKRVKKAC